MWAVGGGLISLRKPSEELTEGENPVGGNLLGVQLATVATGRDSEGGFAVGLLDGRDDEFLTAVQFDLSELNFDDWGWRDHDLSLGVGMGREKRDA
jgi:hypothetical protein